MGPLLFVAGFLSGVENLRSVPLAIPSSNSSFEGVSARLPSSAGWEASSRDSFGPSTNSGASISISISSLLDTCPGSGSTINSSPICAVLRSNLSLVLCNRSRPASDSLIAFSSLVLHSSLWFLLTCPSSMASQPWHPTVYP